MKKSNAKEIENDDVDVCDSAFFPFTIAFELWIRESSADLLWYKLEKNPQQYHHLWLKKNEQYLKGNWWKHGIWPGATQSNRKQFGKYFKHWWSLM